MKAGKHIMIVLTALFVLLGLPALYYASTGAGEAYDSVSGASTEAPEQPAGSFLVLMDRTKHPDTLEAWKDFFSDQPTEVIMEDVACMTVQGDTAGQQLARRYQARLAENQMTVRAENPILVASRAENGLFDVIVLSQEAADTFQFHTVFDDSDVAVLPVKGAPQ